MQEMKLSVLDSSMSPYHGGDARTDSPYHTDNGGYNTSQGEAPGSSPGLPLSLPSDPTPQPVGSPDPGSLTLLQPANNSQGNPVAYSAMLPSFTHYAQVGGSGVGAGVVPGVSDYSYSSHYTQYTASPYGYGYGPAGGLLNGPNYFSANDLSALNQNMFPRGQFFQDAETVEARSPLAATRANSGASASSPTGSACMKSEATVSDFVE